MLEHTQGYKQQVLLVDDERANFMWLNQVLSPHCELIYVSSGKECLNYVINNQVNLVLLDVCMPGIDGFDTCRMIKNTPETSTIPVIIVSGLESKDAKFKGFNAGCDDYIVKPYSVPKLVDLVNGYLGIQE